MPWAGRAGPRRVIELHGGETTFITRTVTLPEGKALFLTIRDVETSSLETVDSGFHADTESEQRANSKWFADHIVNVFCMNRPGRKIVHFSPLFFKASSTA